jgi:ribosome biogenesis SPOUT family RNA methylase Rps3
LKNEENLANVCFMDMRAETELSPADAKTFNFVVFGGILGDHPPQDRAKDFRESFKQIRQLGKVQMTTDTAVLVSREILEEQKPLKSLKFVDDPEIPMDNGIVRFLDEVMPLENIPKMLDQNSET